jgi:hypothetical protein
MKFKSIAQSSLMVLSLLITAAGAHAQTAARANVPFAFKVGTTQLPAGTYAIPENHGSNVVTIRNVQTGSSVAMMGRQEYPSNKTNVLIFHHYGNQYFLSEIRGDRGHQPMVFPATRQEKELKLAIASTNTANTVEIASR